MIVGGLSNHLDDRLKGLVRVMKENVALAGGGQNATVSSKAGGFVRHKLWRPQVRSRDATELP